MDNTLIVVTRRVPNIGSLPIPTACEKLAPVVRRLPSTVVEEGGLLETTHPQAGGNTFALERRDMLLELRGVQAMPPTEEMKNVVVIWEVSTDYVCSDGGVVHV